MVGPLPKELMNGNDKLQQRMRKASSLQLYPDSYLQQLGVSGLLWYLVSV